MEKIIATTSKKFIKYPDLIKKLEKRNCIFIGEYINSLEKIKALKSEYEKVLMLDELNVKGNFGAVNEYLEKLNNVKYICGLSSRYHEFDLKKASELGIRYCNNPDTCSQSVAELALMHLLMLVRRQPLFDNDDFEFFGKNNLGRELGSLSVGILGYGNIGKRIADICRSLGMKVIVWSRRKKESNYPQVGIAKLLEQDVVFISLISGKESKSLFNEKFFNSLDNLKYVVDIVGDDSLYDKNRLIKLCNERKLGGFGFEAEGPKSKYINRKGNVSISPHVAWGTEESYKRLMEGWVKTVVAAYNNKPINVVN
jgi:lactate dehydrogenase-like 2-hydroxyacid dehydrogenase